MRWDGFRPNFFLLFAPGTLDASTGTYMTSVHLTSAQRPLLAELVRQFPSVTAFDVDAILEQIRACAPFGVSRAIYVNHTHPLRPINSVSPPFDGESAPRGLRPRG